MSPSKSDKIISSIISGIVAIIVAIIGTITALKTSGDKLTNLNQKADELKSSISSNLFLIPPGTIASFGGPLQIEVLKSQGWLPCDGRPVDRSEFKALYEQIGTSWGKGDGVHTFNLPDLRGVFLRGVNSGRKNAFVGESGLMDPEANERLSLLDGGNSKNQVGSYQNDSVGPHKHGFQGSTERKGMDANEQDKHYDHVDNSVAANLETSTNSGMETRPKNANVYFIIKL